MKVYKMFMTVCMVIKLSVLSLNAKIAQIIQIADSKVGISKEDDTDSVNGFVRSWLAPGEFSGLEGLSLTGQDYSGRETAFMSEGSGKKVINRNSDAPVKNPVFRIDGWGTGAVSVKVDGNELENGTDYISDIEDGALLIWFNRTFNGNSMIELDNE